MHAVRGDLQPRDSREGQSSFWSVVRRANRQLCMRFEARPSSGPAFRGFEELNKCLKWRLQLPITGFYRYAGGLSQTPRKVRKAIELNKEGRGH